MLRVALTGGIATGSPSASRGSPRSACRSSTPTSWRARRSRPGSPGLRADRRPLRPSRARRRRLARSRRARARSSSATAPRAPRSKRSSIPRSTAASASGSPTCRPARGSRSPTSRCLRDRAQPRLRRGHRLRLRSGRAGPPRHGARRPVGAKPARRLAAQWPIEEKVGARRPRDLDRRRLRRNRPAGGRSVFETLLVRPSDRRRS